MRRMRVALVLLAAVLGLLLAPAPAGAEKTWRYDLYNDVMSPYCPGRTLADCPSPQAGELRAWIAKQEEAGRSREDVEAQLRRLYGKMVLSAPEPHGWGLTAYALPVVAFVGVGAAMVALLRRLTARPPESEAPRAAGQRPVDAELERAVDDELAAS